MAQIEPDVLERDAVGRQEAGAGVPEIVETDVPQAVILQQAHKAVAEHVRGDEAARAVHTAAVQPLLVAAVPEGPAVALQVLLLSAGGNRAFFVESMKRV